MAQVEVLFDNPNCTLEYMLIDEKNVTDHHIRLPSGEGEQVANFYIYDSSVDHEYFSDKAPNKFQSHLTILWERTPSSDYIIK